MTAVSLYFTMGRPFPPQIAPSHRDVDSHPIHGSLGPPSPQPKRQLDRLSHFYRVHYCDGQTDRQTDHATRSVTVGRIYVRSTTMRPNNNNVCYKLVDWQNIVGLSVFCSSAEQ